MKDNSLEDILKTRKTFSSHENFSAKSFLHEKNLADFVNKFR